MSRRNNIAWPIAGIWCCLLLWGIGVPMLAQAQPATQARPGVKAELSKDRVVVGEVFRLQIQVEGGRSGRPIINAPEALEIDVSSPSRSFRTQYIATDFNTPPVFSQETTWEYRVIAREAGTHTIPPIQVEVDDELLTGNALEVEVSEPDRDASGERPAGPTVEDAILVETEVDKEQVYQGEQIALTLRLMQLDVRGIHVRPARRGTLPLPATDGFYTGEIRDYTTMTSRNGFDYLAREFVQPLYPTRPGTLRIGPWAWQGYIEGRTQYGFQQVYREYQTDPIEIEVLPLPERPPGASGAVGRFEISVELDRDFQQGVPVELLLRVVGRGNPDAISNPRLPEISWAHLSSPDTTVNRLDPEGWRQVEKIFRYNLTALDTGEFEVPAVIFTYFSPEQAAYVTAESEPIPVMVRPSAESTALVTFGGSQGVDQVEILGDDVFSIVLSATALEPRGRARFAGPMLGFLMPPLLFAGVCMLHRRRRFLLENPAIARSRRAQARYMTLLDTAEQAEDPSLEIHHALVGYVADKLNLEHKVLIANDVKSLMDDHGVPKSLAVQINQILRTCERKRYSGAPITQDEIAALKSATRDVVAEYEAWSKQGGAS